MLEVKIFSSFLRNKYWKFLPKLCRCMGRKGDPWKYTGMLCILYVFYVIVIIFWNTLGTYLISKWIYFILKYGCHILCSFIFCKKTKKYLLFCAKTKKKQNKIFLYLYFKCNCQFKMESNSKMLWHQIFWLNYILQTR